MLDLGCGSARVVSGLPAEHLVGFFFFNYDNDALSNKHLIVVFFLRKLLVCGY